VAELVFVRWSALLPTTSESEVLWLIVGAPEREFEPGEAHDAAAFYPTDPKELPKELRGVCWPPGEAG
jgi:hypothetical protein